MSGYFGPDPALNPQAQFQFGALYAPSRWEMFKAASSEALQNTTIPLLARIGWGEAMRGGMGAEYLSELGFGERDELQAALGPARGQPITEELWKESDSYRPGLHYFPGMTDKVAEDLARHYDRREWNRWRMSKADDALDVATIVGGSLIGSLPDPVNLLPIAGPAARFLGVTAKAGLLVRAGLGAAEGAAGAAMLAPLMALDAGIHQDDYDARMALTDISIAAGLGGAIGAVGGALSRIGAAKRAAATRRALAQMTNDLPVDVKPAVDVAPAESQITLAGRKADLQAEAAALSGEVQAPLVRERLREIRNEIADIETREALGEVSFATAERVEPEVPEIQAKQAGEEAPPLVPEEVEAVRTEVQNDIDQNLVRPEERAEIDAADAELARAKRFKRSLKDAVFCVMRNG